jgi:hypothetical protein
MVRPSQWQCLLVACLTLSAGSKAWSQANNYQTTAQKARTINDANLPALQNNTSLNTQALNMLRNMYTTSSSMPSNRPAASVGSASVPQSKPFSSYSPQPTVSPYLNLFRVDLNGNNDFNYSTLVQPQLQQQRLNQQIQQQALENSRRVQKIAAQSAYNAEGSKDQYPTGHQTVYSYTGHYFPAVRTNTKRRPQQ